MSGHRKINHYERRRKVQATEACFIGGDDPDRVKKIARAIDDVFSGTIHGDYNSIMEMYGGATPETAHFHTQGIPARFSEYRQYLGLQVHHALNMFFKAASI